jgi:hypothetical protein
VRIAASESLPYLLECARIRGDQYLSDMWKTYILPNLLKAIEIEPEQSVLPEHLNSLAKVGVTMNTIVLNFLNNKNSKSYTSELETQKLYWSVETQRFAFQQTADVAFGFFKNVFAFPQLFTEQ